MEELFHKLTNVQEQSLMPCRKIRMYFHFLLSLAYPIDRLDWALFSVVILFRHWFPLLEKAEIQALILPRNLPAVLIIFTGRGGAGNPPFPAGRGVHPWKKPSICGGRLLRPLLRPGLMFSPKLFGKMCLLLISRSQMSRRADCNLPANVRRLVGCIKIVSR